jgi:hypothetical protein
MAFAFDTLAYAKLLRERGIDPQHAEAHAEAARQFIMAELVTKADLLTTRQQLEAALDNLGLRLTVRLGIMLAAGLGALAALIKLT